MRCDAMVDGLRKEIDGLKKVSVGSLDVTVGMVGTIVKGKGRGSGGIVKNIVKGKRWFIVFFGFITFFCWFIYLFIFNIVLMWKIVGASKVSVLYIYIYI